ncbi:MAG: glycosyltransferase [Mediterranea sp.]|nr:glycosyltransferase [Mediterranea sp.]
MNNQAIKVSVIIPAYNVSSYIRDSLLSIINQTLKEIEIIVVDDGSTDDTLSIVEQMAKEDRRIHFYTIENQGQSVARNIGLYQAVGEYIYFFDSDDLLEQEALELCYLKCKENNLDFVFFDADVFSDIPGIIHHFNYQRTSSFQDDIFDGKDILKRQLLTDGFSASVCLSFIKRSFIYEQNLSFYPRIIHEDELFTFMLYFMAKRVGLVNLTLFHRRLRSHSTMTSSYSFKNVMGCIVVCRELKKYSCQTDVSYSDAAILRRRIQQLLIIVFYNARNMLPKNDCSYIKRVIIHEFIYWLSIKDIVRILFPRIFELIRNIKK